MVAGGMRVREVNADGSSGAAVTADMLRDMYPDAPFDYAISLW